MLYIITDGRRYYAGGHRWTDRVEAAALVNAGTVELVEFLFPTLILRTWPVQAIELQAA